MLNSPAQNKNNEDNTLSSVKSCAKFGETVQVHSSQSLQELHQNRLKLLRKELDFVKESDWKYENIDKYIGQVNN